MGIVLLVLLVVFLGLPVGIGMTGMGACPECHLSSGSAGTSACLAVLSLFSLLLLSRSRAPRSRSAIPRLLLLPSTLERPPRGA